MKRLVLATAVAGGGAFAFRRLAGKARKMHDHCRDMDRRPPNPRSPVAAAPERPTVGEGLEVITVSTSDSRTKPEPVSDQARSLQFPPQIPSLLMVGGPIIAAAAVAGVVVLAALTSWWVLFALFALPLLMMMVCAPFMMAAMRGPMGNGFSAAGWCPPRRRSEVDRATWAD